ncbi:MAG: YggS family pyridoxal phosphate-dependent enzyme [endosymbiont of Galathealinum brachiosum]|uniref:Pyridoxal phosphate homeostasis protein n=1 Tax=endosymbiont of Galathealinum brachiosum TaxID=2200906 RepID=A0A370DET6_9GAMM|nr:MAG: YggS family pyridoxal phosphate-dependent enzyme [endosymbiont of Galathealinum brachiosum]
MTKTSSNSSNIAENLTQIQLNISEYCLKYQRNPQDVKLLAVSKTKPAEDIRKAFDAGQTCFGENYLQESISKIHELSDIDIEWHFIGAIQSNKTRELAENFAWVHSVDRLKIAKRLSNQRPDALPPLNICLQVNISEEESKSGFTINEIETVVDEVIALPNLNLRGLMAIPAKSENLQAQRKAFAEMKSLLQILQTKHPQINTLSMGMTGDMEAAIAEGSTMIRIGTAIFGARNVVGL